MTIPGVEIVDVTAHADERGSFAEIARFKGLPVEFAQANHSRSARNVLRGLHFHVRQWDLWYPVTGRLRVGLADLRDKSVKPACMTLELTSEEPRALLIPPGVAHGYLALEPSDLVYLVTHEYDASDEYGIAWNDPALDIAWQTRDPILSDRDRSNGKLDWDRIPTFS